jgi:hypothetical protein
MLTILLLSLPMVSIGKESQFLNRKLMLTLDHNDPNRGLTYACLDNTRPFNRMPWAQSLSILSDRDGMFLIQNALNACKRLRKSPLLRSSAMQIFGDYGTPTMYTCARLQVSQNSREVLDAAPFMKQLPLCHWKVLVKLMQCSENCFESIMDHQVISLIIHTKKLFPSRP